MNSNHLNPYNVSRRPSMETYPPMTHFAVWPHGFQNQNSAEFVQQTNGGMTRPESQEFTNNNNTLMVMQSEPNSRQPSGPNPSLIPYTQLSPPYSNGSPSSAAASPEQSPRDSTSGEIQGLLNLSQGPHHYVERDIMGNLAARASPSTVPRSGFPIYGLQEHMNYLQQCGMPPMENDVPKNGMKRKLKRQRPQKPQNTKRSNVVVRKTKATAKSVAHQSLLKSPTMLRGAVAHYSYINEPGPSTSFDTREDENAMDENSPNPMEDVMHDCFEDEVTEMTEQSRRGGKTATKIINRLTYVTEPGWTFPRVNKKKEEQMVTCKMCHSQFNTKVKLWVHLKTEHHTDMPIIECPEDYCEFVTDVKHHLEYHLYLHTGEKPYMCELCDYDCINKAMLKSHMKSHSKTYEYHCADCTQKFKFHHTIKEHLEESGHRQGATFDEDGDPCEKVIDVFGKRRGPRKSTGKKQKKTKATRQNFEQVTPLDLTKPGSSGTEMVLNQSTAVAAPTESSPKVPSASRRKGKAVKYVRNQVQDANCPLNGNITVKTEPMEVAPEPEVEVGNCYCQHCHVHFGFQDLYMEHMRYHTIGDPNQCNICHKRYDNAVSFYRHIGIEPHNL